jgi:hypothetical protein
LENGNLEERKRKAGGVKPPLHVRFGLGGKTRGAGGRADRLERRSLRRNPRAHVQRRVVGHPREKKREDRTELGDGDF